MKVTNAGLQNDAETQDVSFETIFSGTAKAWSNLNGTGTIAERDSFNISGYVDNGTGNYSYNLTSSMSDANYATALNVGRVSASEYESGYSTTYPTSGSFRQYTLVTSGSSFADFEAINLSFMGDLA